MIYTIKKYSILLFIITILLLIFGLAMVSSASQVVAMYKYNDAYYYLKRQSLFALIGIISIFLIQKLDLEKIRNRTNIIFLVGIILLIIVLIPGIGLVRGGARSWLGLGSFSIQPSEIMKGIMILFLAHILSKEERSFVLAKNFYLMFFIIGIVFGLILLQPDFGTGVVLLLSSVIMLFFSSAKLKYFIILLVLGLVAFTILIISAPYRLERITAFLDPFSDPLGSGFQTIQAIYAIAPSGIFGLGYGKSIQKHFFLPEPQNDFIFAIICEELGLVGAILLLILLYGLIIVIMKYAQTTFNLFYKYISIGVASSFFVQVSINLGVVVGLIPVTGITLPMISYGGTSLVVSCILIGIVLNCMRKEDKI